MGERKVEGVRACEPGCIYPDEPHLLPLVYWVGDFPLTHGERDDEDPKHPEHCLCGHPNYLTCSGEGLLTMVVGVPYGGHIPPDEERSDA